MSTMDPPEAFSLLADPLRWRIACELAGSDRRVGELVAAIGRPQNVVSYHLRELRNAEIVTARRSSADSRDVYYRVDLKRCRRLLAEAAGALHPGVALVPEQNPSIRISGRPQVLFLCTGNSARSQIAEALLVHRSAGRVDAVSAGSHPKPLHPNAVRVLAERGIDISDRSTKPLTGFLDRRFDRVLTLCDKVREVCPEFPGTPVGAHWSIPDPASSGPTDEATYPAFAEVADDIDDRVELLLTELATTSRGQPHG